MFHTTQLVKGDIVQFNNRTKNPVFIKALAVIDEVKPWGANVFVNCLDKGKVYYRASFAEIDFIGKSPSDSQNINFSPIPHGLQLNSPSPSPATLPQSDEL